MASPLVVGSARALKSTENVSSTALTSRLERARTVTERKGVGHRFARKQSIQAKSGLEGRVSSRGSGQLRTKSLGMERISSAQDPSRVLAGVLGSDSGSKELQKIREVRSGVNLFNQILQPVLWFSFGIAVCGAVGLLAMSIEDSVTGTIIEAVSLGTLSARELSYIFTGLGLTIAAVSYIALLIFLIVMKGLKPMKLSGVFFASFLILPVFDMVPGLNIIPWMILWSFLLCLTPSSLSY